MFLKKKIARYSAYACYGFMFSNFKNLSALYNSDRIDDFLKKYYLSEDQEINVDAQNDPNSEPGLNETKEAEKDNVYKKDENDLEIEISADFKGTFDIEPNNAQRKFSPSKIVDDPKNRNLFNFFYALGLDICKKFNAIIPLEVRLSISKSFDEKEYLSLDKLYVKSDWFYLGKAHGNFNKHVSESDRYSTLIAAFVHKINDNFSYTIAIEEGNFYTKDDETEKKKKMKAISPKKNSKDKQLEFDVDSTEIDNIGFYTVNYDIISRIAGTLSVTWKGDLGNLNLSGLFGMPSYYYGKKFKDDTEDKITTAAQFGVALGGKIILINFVNDKNKKERLSFSGHIKFTQGLGAYHSDEAGGLPAGITADGGKGNFFVSNTNKDYEQIKYLGGSLSGKFFYNQMLYSSFAVKGFVVLNNGDYTVKNNKDKFNDGFVGKVAPIGIEIQKCVFIEPSYSIALKNLFGMNNSDIDFRNRVELNLSVSLPLSLFVVKK
jgi:hypothetical protein